MKILRLLAFIYLLLPIFSIAADAPAVTLINELKGVYKYRFTGGNDRSEIWPAEDIVEIVPFDDSHIYVRASLEFGNGHMCTIWGIAEYKNNAFIYREPEKVKQGDPSCTLKVYATKKKLVLTDVEGANEAMPTCRAHCGARGGLTNFTIDRKSKRKIRYLGIVKASQQYLEAVEAFKEKANSSPEAQHLPSNKGADAPQRNTR